MIIGVGTSTKQPYIVISRGPRAGAKYGGNLHDTVLTSCVVILQHYVVKNDKKNLLTFVKIFSVEIKHF